MIRVENKFLTQNNDAKFLSTKSIAKSTRSWVAYLVSIGINDLETQETIRSLLQENGMQTNTISIGTNDKVLVPSGITRIEVSEKSCFK